MTPREQRKFSKLTRDLEAESKRELREYINGVLREIKENTPAELCKYKGVQVGEKEAEIVAEILKLRLEDIDGEIAALQQIFKKQYC